MHPKFFLSISLLILAMGLGLYYFSQPKRNMTVPSFSNNNIQPTTTMTEEEWKAKLTPEQYYILREKGTEAPFSSPLLEEHRPGTFVSADCGEPLFRSEQKFDSGTGWPSFWAPINKDAVIEETDDSLFMVRTEVMTKKCGGHLGHVFNDGPAPTGLRYCINGAALKFIPDES